MSASTENFWRSASACLTSRFGGSRNLFLLGHENRFTGRQPGRDVAAWYLILLQFVPELRVDYAPMTGDQVC